MKKVLLVVAMLAAPAVASATTIVVESSGAYDATSDSLFSGIAIASTDGPGTYTVDFFSPGTVTAALAEVAVTDAPVIAIFKDLTMTWLDGASLNTLVQAPGIGTLSTVFQMPYLSQRLQFSWSDSVKGAGFSYDVATSPAPIPLPASIFLLGAALGGSGWIKSRGRAIA